MYTYNFNTRKKAAAYRIIAFVTLVAFLFTSIGADGITAKAYASNNISAALENQILEILNKEFGRVLNPVTFTLPRNLGTVEDAWMPGKEAGQNRNKTIIHIQDAHCNYDAQQRIADIIEYLHTEYEINVVNMEGGIARYDLTPFTRITENDIREQVSEYFVREGTISGAEQFAINNPGKVTLWGVEEAVLYKENLMVYRDSLKYRHSIEESLKSLNHILTNLKLKIYSKNLLEFDMRYAQYKANNLSFTEYFDYLIKQADALSLDVKQFENISLLQKTLSCEKGIDFKRANSERDEFIAILQSRISEYEIESLVKEIVGFKSGTITPVEFYNYLIRKAELIKYDLKAMPNLYAYIHYIELYDHVDKTRIMEEIAAFEDLIRENLYELGNQRKLGILSKNLVLMKNLFNTSITKEDYVYYKKNAASFEARNYITFIQKQAPLYGIMAKPDPGIANLDQYREEMAGFYECSIKRDRAFIRNLKFVPENDMEVDPQQAAILVTGGFHTENLTRLLKEEGISYISIMPDFKNDEGYESPYFRLIAGKERPIDQNIRAILASKLAYYSVLNNIRLIVGDVDEDILFAIRLRWVEAAVRKKTLIFKDKGNKGLSPAGGIVEFDVDEVIGNDSVETMNMADITDKVVSNDTMPNKNTVETVQNPREQDNPEFQTLAGKGTFFHFVFSLFHEPGHIIAYMLVHPIASFFGPDRIKWKDISRSIVEGKFTLPRPETGWKAAFIALDGRQR